MNKILGVVGAGVCVVAVLAGWLGPWAGWLVPTYPVMLGLAIAALAAWQVHRMNTAAEDAAPANRSTGPIKPGN